MAQEEEIAQYCETQLGTGWKTFTYTPPESEYTQTYAKIKATYHKDVNRLFADSIQKMLAVIEGEKSFSQICTANSISKKVATVITTYEISQKALCRYARYQAVLKARINYILSEDLQNADIQSLISGDPNLQTNLYKGLQLFQEQVDAELEIAKISLDKTLAVYDEMLIAYPLHLRFRCIISDLLEFRKQLGKLVNLFFCLDRYIDGASEKMD